MNGRHTIIADTYAQQCRNRPLRQRCTQTSNATKIVTRHVWEAT